MTWYDIRWILRIFFRWQILTDGGHTTWYTEFLCRIKKSYAMPSQDILCQIYRIPTYMESYTPTHLDIRCSLINLLILYFTRLLHSIFFFTPHVPTA